MDILDILNELSFLTMSYLLMISYTLSSQGQLKYYSGWFMILLFGLNFFLNIGVIIYSMFSTLRKKLCRKRKSKRVKKRPKKEQEEAKKESRNELVSATLLDVTKRPL